MQYFFSILFKCWNEPQVTGDRYVQKCVAHSFRLGFKAYGILSVLMQAFFKVEYLFDVNEALLYASAKGNERCLRFY